MLGRTPKVKAGWVAGLRERLILVAAQRDVTAKTEEPSYPETRLGAKI